MNIIIVILMLCCCLAQQAAAQVPDSSDMLFDDTVVHAFDISFYTEHWQDSLIHYYENDEQYMPARITYAGVTYDSVGVRYKGNSSYMQARHTPKKPFKFKFDKFRNNQRFYGITRLNFSNAAKDPSFMREKLAYDILRTWMVTPRAAFATLSIDGNLLGLYTQVEQVDKSFLARHFESNDYNLYKAGDNGATLEYKGTDTAAYKRELDLKTNEKADDWSRLISMLDAVNRTPAKDFVRTAGIRLNLDNTVRMLAFNMTVSNFDSYLGSGRNFYLYDDESDGRFLFIPWDMNEAFGAFTNNWNIFTQDIFAVPNLPKRPVTRKVFENDSLRHVYSRYILELLRGGASLDSMTARVMHWKDILDPYVRADMHKLYSYQAFLDNIDKDVVVGINMIIPGLLRFARLRNESLLSQVRLYTDAVNTPPVAETLILLLESFPNPAVTDCSVHFELAQAGRTTLRVYDVFGSIAREIDLGYREAGRHLISSISGDLPAGVYVLRLDLYQQHSAIRSSETRSLVILR